jgi:carboxylate-amine ligase
MLTFGVEEEFVLLDRGRLSPGNKAATVRRALFASGFGASEVHREFFQSQLEYASPVLTDLSAAAAHLSAFRSALSAAAEAHQVQAAGVGTPFDLDGEPAVSEGARYGDVAAMVRGLTADHQINGLHVHVGIPSRAAGVAALNGVRRWLPVLLAISANSPFWRGADTGFASWRAIHSRRWTTAGCPPVFAGADDYAHRVRALTGIGATADAGTIAWYARLSERLPTLEFRVADAQLDAATSVLLAALCRALVATALRDTALRVPTRRAAPRAASGREQPAPELLDAALWHAARDGLTSALVHPVPGGLVPAAQALGALLEETHAELAGAGDLAYVEGLLRDTLAHGSGAERQRRAVAAGGITALGELVRLEMTRPGGSCRAADTLETTSTPSPHPGGPS